MIRPEYELVAARAAEVLGRPVRLLSGESLGQLESGELDGAFLCGLPYVRLHDRPGRPVEALAAPVASGERYGGRPIYFSDVVVRRDSGVGALADLRGRSWAFNEPGSHSGHNVVLAELAARGEGHGFFATATATGSHAAAMRLVAAGEADGAAIDSQVLAAEMAADPVLGERLRVVESLGPSPIPPLVASTRLEPRERDGLRGAAVSTVAGGGAIERWVAVGDAAYDPVRRMAAAACRAVLVGPG